jgi:FAD binding domain
MMRGTIIQETLDSTFAGELIRPGDPGYDDARQLFNGSVDKRPALIARCTGPRDVQAALAHARGQGLPVAVRGGGHSAVGYSSCDDGIVIDTGPMKSVDIDVDGRTGRFGAGLTWGELDAATQEHGLAVTGGRVTHTGIAGLTLGSGSGWIDRKLGSTCESLISAEVVTADGRVVGASADENADLLWGLKGGGGNFGVVTEFEFRLHPVGPIVFAGMILHPRAAARELLRFYRDLMEQAPDEVGGGFALLTAPPEDFVPEEARGKPAAGLILVYVGDPEHGEETLRPLLEWGEPLVKLVQPMPYVAVQQLIDAANPWGITDYYKIDYLPELPDEAIDAAVDTAAGLSLHSHRSFSGRSEVRSHGRTGTRWRSRCRIPSGSISTSRCRWIPACTSTRRGWPGPSPRRCGRGGSTRRRRTSSTATIAPGGSGPPTATKSSSAWWP